MDYFEALALQDFERFSEKIFIKAVLFLYVFDNIRFIYQVGIEKAKRIIF